MRILFVLVLAGCATLEQDLAPAKASWQGTSYEEVVKRWGKPARSSGPSHTWVSEGHRKPPAPSVGIFGGSGGGVGIFGGITFGASGEPVRCDRSLTFRNGVVAEQTWTGPPDYCKTFTRE